MEVISYGNFLFRGYYGYSFNISIRVSEVWLKIKLGLDIIYFIMSRGRRILF